MCLSLLFLTAFLFSEFSDANAKFYCRIYYAKEFHKMREEIMESSEEDFVRSLSHCVNWQARGGKSGAVFYATEGWSWYPHRYNLDTKGHMSLHKYVCAHV